MSKKVNEKIKSLEYSLAKLRFVQSHFPDVTFSQSYGNKDVLLFNAKSVNNSFTKFNFRKDSWNLTLVPYSELSFIYDGKEEIIRVSSSPQNIKLITLSYRTNSDGKRIMKFHKFTTNLKKNNFKEDIFNACRAEIMKVIQDNQGFHLDTKNLEPRLKKLLVFT